MDAIGDEQSLVQAARSGDGEAFGRLVRAHQEVAFRAAYLIVRDPAAAEDIAQEAFVRAYRGLGSFREGEPFRPWLLRIVSNLAKNEVRSRTRRAGLWDRLVRLRQPDEPSPEASVAASDEHERLAAAIGELPLDDRMVLYLRFFLELPEEEVARVLGVARGTVKSRQHRASDRLRRLIEARYPSLRREGGGA